MSDRADLVKQMKATLDEADMSRPVSSDEYRQFLAEWIVKAAGWRPPPSGDVIEQAAFQVARVLVRRPCPAVRAVTTCEVCMRTPRDIAQVVADAGLLATPVQQDTETVIAGAHDADTKWTCGRCGSHRWVGWRAGPEYDGWPRKAQCVLCGRVQDLLGPENGDGSDVVERVDGRCACKACRAGDDNEGAS